MSYKSKVLEPDAGGTGVANNNTITLAGNLVTSGANSLTLTTTGATNVTLPTSGTLATSSQIPSFPLSISNGGTNASSFTQSNGIVAYNGTSLVNYAGPQLSSSGVMTNTSQPAFLATGGAANNVTGNSGTYSLGASAVMTEVFDQNNNFTVGDGAGTAATFTAPVTGKYYLECSIRTAGFVASTNANYRIVTTARTYIGYAVNPLNVSSSGAGVIGTFSVLANMNAGDTATFAFTATGEASNVCDVADSFVSGYLVC